MRRPQKTAAEWVARLSAAPLSSEEEQTLRHWLAEAPSHVHHFEQAQSIWKASAGLKHSELARTYLARDMAKMRTGSTAVLSFARLAAAVAVLAVILPTDVADAPRLDDGGAAQSAKREIKNYALPDLSLVTIAGDSAIEIAFADRHRDAKLKRGEAFFEVQRDARRPFVVTAGQHRVTVTGTKFNVRNLPGNAVEVAVTEGSVAVAAGEDDEFRYDLRAGDVFLFPAAGVPVRRHTSAEDAAAWRSGRLHFDDANLNEVLAEVNRYAVKPIVANAADVTGLTLTARINANDTDALLVILKELFQFEVEDYPDRWQLVARR